MPFVLDAAAALSWCLPDETLTPAEHLFAELASAPAVAPAIWPLEVGNALRTAHRRGRLTVEQLRTATELLDQISVDLVTLVPATVFTQVLPLALAQNLSVYDATYLAVAQQQQAPLATADRRLAEAARSIGIPVLCIAPSPGGSQRINATRRPHCGGQSRGPFWRLGWRGTAPRTGRTRRGTR